MQVVKIKTIGDCYVCASGVLSPMLGGTNHAEAMISMAIDMHLAIQQINEEFGHGLRLRIGMHSGTVLGGIMGTRKLNFDLWGETVEMANKMEETGVAERIHVSETTCVILREGNEGTRAGHRRGSVGATQNGRDVGRAAAGRARRLKWPPMTSYA
jgi:class 3 adenylate cyclase